MPGCSIGLLFQGWSREVPLRLRLYHMPSRELPPLARGLPSPSCSASAGGGDHPRSRGVYSLWELDPEYGYGSSPLARGLRYPHRGDRAGGGIIPARAGFTGWWAAIRPRAWDHPRSRGVYRRLRRCPPGDWGSSPLARGLPGLPAGLSAPAGIIPARAGFTPRAPARSRGCGDHPRSRGVYHALYVKTADGDGSSPLARGLLTADDVIREGNGIIPARAGFTGNPQPCHPGLRDHPRSRGVYGSTGEAMASSSGSSPLARGLPRVGPHSAERPRIIPARAGFTQVDREPLLTVRDHPRSRGVYAGASLSSMRTRGSSPLARGLPFMIALFLSSWGIIPARAGFTARRQPGACRTTDHPRSRGVYPETCTNRTSPSGSSPLARGLLVSAIAEGVDGLDHPRSRGVYRT